MSFEFTPGDDRFPAIADYGAIGDCRTAALVSRDGSIEWLCLPRFDSPSVFAAVLDRTTGGRFAIRPTAPFDADHRYWPRTNVLETTFRTATGIVRLTDLMPVCPADARHAVLHPEREVLRRIEGVEGEVAVEVVYDPRFEYGRRRPRIHHDGALGWRCEHRALALNLLSDVDLDAAGCGLRGVTTLRPGDRADLSLAVAMDEPAVLPPLGEGVGDRITETVGWWREFSRACTYRGRYRDAVTRSALALKLATFAPSGAVVAAPTTSLPEWIGGERNWDYRFCWLRDASLTVRALLGLGYRREAAAFFDWVLHATWLGRPDVDALYDLHGNPGPSEVVLDHLAGYRDSRPVRTGNAARGQRQLDVYGEVIAAAAELVGSGETLDRSEAALLEALAGEVVATWDQPDKGFWEPRTPPRQFTHSKVQCWVAVDRMLDLDGAGVVSVPRDRYGQLREEIRATVEERGFNAEVGSYVSELDADYVDATLLLLGLNGYADPAGERMTATAEVVRSRLGRDGLLDRHGEDFREGVPGVEGAFGICSFWQVELWARRGQVEKAVRGFERLLGYGSRLGLFAEEIDPETGALLGNFPQAFTHVGLINAALAIDGSGEGRERR